jgi:hypothetical protein
MFYYFWNSNSPLHNYSVIFYYKHIQQHQTAKLNGQWQQMVKHSNLRFSFPTTWLFLRNYVHCRSIVWMYSGNLIPELHNTAHSCSQDGPVNASLRSEYLLCWEHKYIVSHNKITSVNVAFCMLFYNFFLLKIFDTPLRSIA